MGIFDFLRGNSKANETKLEHKQERETKKEEGMFWHIVTECDSIDKMIVETVRSFSSKVVDSWKLANLVKAQIRMVEIGYHLNDIEKENRNIISLANRISAKFPNDKVSEKKIKTILLNIEARKTDMGQHLSNFLMPHNLSDIATAIRKGKSPNDYAGVFMKCRTTLKNVAKSANECHKELAWLFKVEKKYLSA